MQEREQQQTYKKQKETTVPKESKYLPSHLCHHERIMAAAAAIWGRLPACSAATAVGPCHTRRMRSSPPRRGGRLHMRTAGTVPTPRVMTPPRPRGSYCACAMARRSHACSTHAPCAPLPALRPFPPRAGAVPAVSLLGAASPRPRRRRLVWSSLAPFGSARRERRRGKAVAVAAAERRAAVSSAARLCPAGGRSSAPAAPRPCVAQRGLRGTHKMAAGGGGRGHCRRPWGRRPPSAPHDDPPSPSQGPAPLAPRAAVGPGGQRRCGLPAAGGDAVQRSRRLFCLGCCEAPLRSRLVTGCCGCI